MRDQAQERLKRGAEYAAELDLVFANGLGEPLDYRVVVQRHFKPIVKAAGLEPFRAVELGFWALGFHSPRHVGTADHLHLSLPLPT